MKRPNFLTIILVFWPVLSILTFFWGLADSPNSFGDIIGIKSIQLEISLGLLFLLAQIIGIIMTWRYMKYGIYILIGILITGFILNVVSKAQSQSQISVGSLIGIIVLEMISTGLLLGVLYLAIKPVWKNFK